MKRSFLLVLLAALALSVPGLTAQDKPAYQDKLLAPGIHELTIHDRTGFLLKVIASVGDDGLLIVDSGIQGHSAALVEALNKLGKGMPRIVINTHSHAEHLAGQAAFGRGATIIGHKNLRDRFVNGLYVFNDLPVEALPWVTFGDSMSIHFNGEEIKLIAFPGAHDDSDTVVWFTKSKVVCTEALCNCGHFPSYDGETGDLTRYPETVEKMLRVLPDDVLLVPGHSEDCDMSGARAFLDMLIKTRELVRMELAKGKTLDDMRKEDLLASYKSFESYVGRNDWLQGLVIALGRTKVERGNRAWPYGLLYKAYKEKGAPGLLQVYKELKATKSDIYFFSEDTLLFAARRLIYVRNDAAAGIPLLEEYVKEYPTGQNMPTCHQSFAVAYENLGNKAEALKYYRLALTDDPADAGIAAKIKELEGPAEKK